MNCGIIGAGTIARALAQHLVAAGHRVVLSNSRGPSTLGEVVANLGPLASAGTAAQAAKADMVFLTVMWPDIPAALAGLPPWDGRILVDTTNQFARLDPVEVADLGDQTGSEWVAGLAPGARVIKAFNTLFAQYIAADPRHPAGRQLLFYAGDDATAKTTFRDVVDGFGFAPVDIGGLRDGGRLMQVGGGPLSGLHALRQD
ncbi:NADPH-dependent F420 reductase [Mycolicibacterium tokaiense]|uniref:Putative NADP oxidoreductase coenzymeF420-dependent family protein n=1 Tax=Mycolicibacterium tokaiense TaxID=39695 RepID=A0A378TD30_9MYCO|nr:NAD(P)-binding domain-containing protein [Mycolicibacterium tokaiense]BBY87109.1 NADP oxidoreductase [Mycolicibacterium tokaiense]STZ58374.1 putative NADP oxidoreductase coenzymeF420-dependent family protein [Mycolicibacterium tokaiense]